MTIEALPVDEAFAEPAGDESLSRAAKGLRERGFTAHVVETVADARVLVRDLLPRDKAIFTANSETLRHSGLLADIDDGEEFVSVRAQIAGIDDVRVQITKGATPEVIVGSVHAVTEDGILVAASASGSQLGPYGAGAGKVVYVVGGQKVVPNLDTAFRRVRTYSYPKEHERWRVQGFETFIGKMLVVEREYDPTRATVVLIREAIGY